MSKTHTVHTCTCGCGHDHKEHHHEDSACPHCEAKLQEAVTWSRPTLVRIIVAAILYVTLFFLPVHAWIALLAYLIPYFVVGYDVILTAICNVLRGKVFDEQFLMTLATVGAFAVGEYPEAVAVMLFYQLGELLQTMAIGHSRQSVAKLMEIRPDVAHVLREGREDTLPPDAVLVGETVVVRAGERIPLDGVIVKGESAVDTAALTGESVPVSLGVGDRVLSGSVNLNGCIYIKVESAYHESTVARVLELAEHSAQRKARVERFITRFSRYYTPAVVGFALVLAFVTPLALGQSFSTWIYRALSFLVVSCPCALVISVPLSFFCGIGAASRHGVLVKGAEYLEQLSRVDVVAFDKTGTLTKGTLSVARVYSEALSERELLGLAAALENGSSHPVARGILRAFGEEPRAACDVMELGGKGVRGRVDGERVTVGNLALMQEIGVAVLHECQDKTSVYVARNDEYMGCITFSDEARVDAAHALAALKASGVGRTVMLTGDRQEIALQLGKAVGVDEVHAELMPDEKVRRVETLIEEGKRVAFVGDGINDAPVLARADIGIAMGGIGSDAAIESADVVLMEDSLRKLPIVVRLARKTMRIVRQNIVLALLAKTIILLLAAFGIANMWVAVFGDVGVMLLATCNALRLCNAGGRDAF